MTERDIGIILGRMDGLEKSMDEMKAAVTDGDGAISKRLDNHALRLADLESTRSRGEGWRDALRIIWPFVAAVVVFKLTEVL